MLFSRFFYSNHFYLLFILEKYIINVHSTLQLWEDRKKDSFGAFLCAALNQKEQRFETFTKVGTGFTAKDAKEIDSLLSEHIVPDIPKNVVIKNRMLPNIFIEPAIVIEVLGMEITKSPKHTAGKGKGETGLALRFRVFYVSGGTKGPMKLQRLKR